MPPISWTSKWRMPEGPLHRLAGHREDVRQDLVEGRLDRRLLALAARLGELAAALEVRVGELLLGRLAGRGGLVDLLADQREALADLVVGERLRSRARAR